MFTFIFSLGLPAVADAFFSTAKTEPAEESPGSDEALKVDAVSGLPDGFIALSETDMPWVEAKAWCESKGGKLPRINDSNSWYHSDTVNIDGFGAMGTPWTAVGLPSGFYWTGTAHRRYQGNSWLVYNRGGSVDVARNDQVNDHRVVCVR